MVPAQDPVWALILQNPSTLHAAAKRRQHEQNNSGYVWSLDCPLIRGNDRASAAHLPQNLPLFGGKALILRKTELTRSVKSDTAQSLGELARKIPPFYFPYQPAMTGITQTLQPAREGAPRPISAGSTSWWPYVKLMRIRLFTTIIMYPPYLHGSLFAACASAERIPVCDLSWVNIKLLISALLSHSWACTWNDIDRLHGMLLIHGLGLFSPC